MIAAANWKMNKTLGEARAWVEKVAGEVPAGVEAMVFPPYTAIATVAEAARGRLAVGAQDVFYENEGAFTGAISPTMAGDAGCTYTLIGHSERRSVFGETDRDIQTKLRFVLATDLKPVLCIGESLEDFDRGDTRGAVRRQLGVAFKDLEEEKVRGLTIAYEPVWAIGTGRSATVIEAERAGSAVHEVVGRLYGEETGRSVRILYGGSVTPENVRGYLVTAGMDGVLVGSASLDAASFVALMQQAVAS